MARQEAFWNAVYAGGDRERSWYQEVAETSLDLIASFSRTDAPVVDVGGGASTLVDGLLDAGYSDVTVLDIAESALAIAQRRLGSDADRVTWLREDMMTWRPERRFAVWHDRAVLHFLTAEEELDTYRGHLLNAVDTGGRAVIGTFGPEGPDMCSGLPVRRYDVRSIAELLGPTFVIESVRTAQHVTPGGADQQFLWTVAQRR
jgi:hypothetical protein